MAALVRHSSVLIVYNVAVSFQSEVLVETQSGGIYTIYKYGRRSNRVNFHGGRFHETTSYTSSAPASCPSSCWSEYES